MEDVCSWFDEVVRLPQYVSNVEGLEVSDVGAWLSTATNEALHKDLHVKSKVHRKKILQQVAEHLDTEATAKAEAQSAADSVTNAEKGPGNEGEDSNNVSAQPTVAAAAVEVNSEGTNGKKKNAALFVCKHSGKKFKSKATYENHLRSKKYKQLEKKAQETAAAAAEAEAAAEAALEKHARENPVVESCGNERESGNDDPNDSDSSEEWFDDDTPWTPFLKESLFDAHESKSFEANLEYMGKAHSFFVPYESYLVDKEGLFSYLQEKICLYHSCLYCKMAFESLEACQNHMADKSHKKVNFETDYGALELSKFYDFNRGRKSGGVAAAAGPFMSAHKDNSGELVLASGVRVGSRSLKRYYKQQYRPTDNRVSVRINLRIQSEQSRRMGMNVSSKIAMRRERNMRNGVLVKSLMYTKGNSKAISSQFVFKQGAADNAQNRAIVHHWGAGGGGSHYCMAGSKQFQKGNKVKGIVARGKKSKGNQVAIRNGKKSGAKKSGSMAVMQ